MDYSNGVIDLFTFEEVFKLTALLFYNPETEIGLIKYYIRNSG